MIKKISFGHANCYLVEQNGNFMLIDTEMPGSSGRLISLLEREGVTRENFRLIVLTHGHVDHAGNAEALRSHFDVKIAVGREDARLLETADLTFPGAHNLFTKILRMIVMAMESRYSFEPFEPDVLLEDGLDLGRYGFDAEVISLRGHTPGSVGVILGEHIFTGDAAMFLAGRIAPSIFGQDLSQMKMSLEKIIGFRKENIHNGH